MPKSITVRVHFTTELRTPQAVADATARAVAEAVQRATIRDDGGSALLSAAKVEAWPTRGE